MKIQKIELDSRAQAFIRNRLDYGHSFAKYILDELDLSKGHVITWLPSTMTSSQIYDFENGGKLPQPSKESWRKIVGGWMVPTPSTRDELATEIEDYFCRTAFPICFLENAYAQPEDKGIMKQTGKLWFFNNEVYHVITTEDKRPETILKIIGEAQHPPTFIGGLVSWPNDQIYALDSRQYLSIDQLRMMAQRTDELIVSTYDGEGYLVWCR